MSIGSAVFAQLARVSNRPTDNIDALKTVGSVKVSVLSTVITTSKVHLLFLHINILLAIKVLYKYLERQNIRLFNMCIT